MLGGLRTRLLGSSLRYSTRRWCGAAGVSSKNSPHCRPSYDRDDRFAICESRDIEYFREVLGDSNVLTTSDDLAPYETDWLGIYRGCAPAVLLPKSTDEVSKVLSYCNNRCLAVVPQGGNTGLVGGSVPVFDEIILSTRRMNEICKVDEHSGAVECEAGCILETLDGVMQSYGFTVPLDLGAKGSCYIGGNVSTNAGGSRLCHYGPLAGNVLGLEVVLADGSILDMLSLLRKNNTGYKTYQLFIGSEGTLGVITKVALQCSPSPVAREVTLLQCKTFQDVLSVAREVRQRVGDIVTAMELFDNLSLQTVLSNVAGTRDPFPRTSPFYLLVETSTGADGGNASRLEDELERLVGMELIQDGVQAKSENDYKDFWKLRESITSALSHEGEVLKYDVTLPREEMYTPVNELRKRLERYPQSKCVGYGHLGDSNIHINIRVDDGEAASEIREKAEAYLWPFIKKMRGSVSAEHGLGQMKAEKLVSSNTPTHVQTMSKLKFLFDKRGILNPYKVIPPQINVKSSEV